MNSDNDWTLDMTGRTKPSPHDGDSATGIILYGYRYSVYTWIVRLVLKEIGIAFKHIEMNPFEELPASYLRLHPFGAVPALGDGKFVLHETRAICLYLDATYGQAALQPKASQSLARMHQAISIVDNYGYRPWIRQVFAQASLRPRFGGESDREVVNAGLQMSRPVLKALDDMCREGLILCAKRLTLADIHLAPMMSYFTRAKPGRAALIEHAGLFGWWQWIQAMPSLIETDPWPDRRHPNSCQSDG